MSYINVSLKLNLNEGEQIMLTTIKVILIIITVLMALGTIATKDSNEQLNLLVAFITSVIAIVVLQIYA